MLFLVAAWLVLLAVSVPTGAAIVRWVAAERVFDRPGDRVVLSAWLGLVAVGSLLLAASLLFALSPLVGALVGGAAASAALSWCPVREEIAAYRARLTGGLITAFLALAAGVAAFTAQPVVWPDTGLYHASAIRWLSELGAVEGVALVHDRLGFGSTWFALAAPFNPDGLRDHAVAVMGGLALLLLCLHALICVARAVRARARFSDWLLIAGSALLIAGMGVVLKAHVSASPDLPVSILGLVVGWSILSVAQAPRGGGSPGPRLSPGPESVPLVVAVATMTLKPQAAPLVAVAAAFYVLWGDPWPRRAAWVVAIAAVGLAPWIAYEFVSTGCPAYPLPVCVDVPWSVGTDAAREVSETIQSFARWRTDPAPGSGLEWVGPWLTDDLSRSLGAVAAIFVLALAGGLVLGSRARPRSAFRMGASWVAALGAASLFLIAARTDELLMVSLAGLSLIPLARPRPGTGWLLALGLTGVGVTLYVAPDPRFAFGYMAVLFGRLAIFQGPAVWARVRRSVEAPGRVPEVGLATLMLAAAAVAALGPAARPTTSRSEVLERLDPLRPPASTASVRVQRVNGIEYRVPANPDGLCRAAELPCSPAYEIHPDVMLRDPDRGISGGFTRAGES